MRWGYFVGMIDEDTAHSILEVCAEEACARFEGWRDFGVSYLFGGLFWRISAGEDEAAEWIENAGGAATTGRQAILDVVPEKVHQRVAVFLGAAEEVELVTGYHLESDAGMER